VEEWDFSNVAPAVSTSVENSVRSELIASGLILTTGSFVQSLPIVTYTGTAPSTPPISTPPPTTTPTYAVTTETITSTISYNAVAGYMSIAGNLRSDINPKGGLLLVSDYDLNFYYPRTTVDVCSGGFEDVYGVGSPKPSNWYDIPKSVSFFSTITSFSQHFSNCVYTNSAAPSNGDGGTLSCAGTVFGCAVATFSILTCNPDIAGDAATSIKPLINCPVYEPTTEVYTYTTYVTRTST
jgi:hypothetical protein